MMKSLLKRLLAILTFPPLWYVLAFAACWGLLELYVWDKATLPQPGETHVLISENDPEASLSLKIPAGWSMRRMQATESAEKFSFAPSKGNYPYLIFEMLHPEPEDSERIRKAGINCPPLPLFETVEQDKEHYDPVRKAVWKIIPGPNFDRVEVTLLNGPLYRIHYFHTHAQRYSLSTLPKVVDSIHSGPQEPPENDAESTASSVTSNSTKSPRFEMSSEAELLSVGEAPLRRLQILGIAAALMFLLLIGYWFVRRREVEQRIQETTRMMSAVKRGQSLTRDFGPESNADET